MALPSNREGQTSGVIWKAWKSQDHAKSKMDDMKLHHQWKKRTRWGNVKAEWIYTGTSFVLQQKGDLTHAKLEHKVGQHKPNKSQDPLINAK